MREILEVFLFMSALVGLLIYLDWRPRTIMSELPNFPFVNQLDGSENAEFNCIPACISAGLQYFTGKTYHADILKDSAYGEGWRNSATFPEAFVSFCQQEGVKLSSVVAASPAEVLQLAHTFLARGLPIVFIQQDDYAPSQYRKVWRHACVWYADEASSLTAMDPYGGKTIIYTDAIWATRLRSNTIWIMEKETTLLQLTDSMGNYFREGQSGRWHCRNGIDLFGAHLQFYRLHGGIFGLPLTNEIYLPAYPGTAIVVYECAVAIYDPNGALERLPPRHQQGVYLIHLDAGLGQEIIARPLVTELQQQLAKLQERLHELDPDVVAAMKLALRQIQALAWQYSS